jgi:hypothetical protein
VGLQACLQLPLGLTLELPGPLAAEAEALPDLIQRLLGTAQ